jgi:hypothetical protein
MGQSLFNNGAVSKARHGGLDPPSPEDRQMLNNCILGFNDWKGIPAFTGMTRLFCII